MLHYASGIGYARDHTVMQSTQSWGSALPAPNNAPCTSSPLAPRDQQANGQGHHFFPAQRALRRSRKENGKLFFFSCSSVQPKRNSASCRDSLIHKGTRMPQLSYRAKPTRCNQLGLARRPPLCAHLGFTPTSLADMAEHRLDLPALMCTGMGTWQ